MLGEVSGHARLVKCTRVQEKKEENKIVFMFVRQIVQTTVLNSDCVVFLDSSRIMAFNHIDNKFEMLILEFHVKKDLPTCWYITILIL